MSPFSLISNHMGVHVSGFQSILSSCNNRDRFHTRKTPCFKSYRGGGCNLVSISGCGSLCLSSLGSYYYGKSSNGLSCYKETRSVISMSNENNQRNSSKNEASSSDRRKRFSLRLRPRLRLLSMRLKRVSFRAMLNDLVIYVQKNLKQVTISTVISVALGICYLFLRLTSVPSPTIVPYSDLISNLHRGHVSKVLFEEGSRRIYYNTTQALTIPIPESFQKQSPTGDKLSENVGETVLKPDGMRTRPLIGMSMFKLRRPKTTRVSTPVWQYSTRKIDHDEHFLLALMRKKGTIYSSAPQSVLMSMRTILLTILTLWIPVAPLMWLLYRQLNTTNSLAKKRRPTNQTVSFEDVEGVDAAKTELMEIVLCLQGAINYSKLGAKLPRGVLLAGPPGTGKTLLARAVAGEAGVPFFSVSASEFVEMFVGRGASRIRDLFSTARKSAPSIIFIDELDAVGGKRGRTFNDERDQTLNQLLTEMDGFETDTKVIVIAATNRPEALDSALCRPGRFSRKVLVGKPDEDGRRKIFAVHLREVPLEEDPYIISNLVASLTQGFVGADLANIVNEAALLAARRGGETVAREDIMDAVERAKYGINNNLRNASAIRKELGKLLPWVPSFMRKDDIRENGLQEPLGYQTLS